MRSTRRVPAILGPLVGGMLCVAACGPRQDDLNLVRARNAMAQDRADWARTYYSEDRRQHPDHIDSLLGEAVAWSTGYQRSRARTRELLRDYLEERPRDQEALARYLDELLIIRDLSEAERRIELLDSSKGADLLRARVWATNRPERALALVESVLDRAPETAAAWALKAELAEKIGQFSSSISAAETALELDPFKYSTIYLLARGYRREGKTEAADSALETHGIVAALEADGTRKTVGVIEELDLLERLRPLIADETGPYRTRLVAALFRAGHLTEAIAEAERALDERTHSTSELAGLAVLADEAGARALARRVFMQVVDRQPDHVGAQTSLIMLDLEAGRIEEARRRLLDAKVDHPDFARLWFVEGRLTLAEGDGDRAVAAFEHALLMAPWEWRWRAALGELYLARRDERALQRIVVEAPESPPGWKEWRTRHRGALGGEQ